VQTDRALQWLGRYADRDATRPFCLFVSWGPPHDPYRPLPPGKEDVYDPTSLRLRGNVKDELVHPVYGSSIRRDLADYYAHITAIDEQVGRIVDQLRRSGMLENTNVVYSSDHGTMLYSHGLFAKTWPYEESIGVPLVIRGPGLMPGTVSPVPIGIVDIAPTLLGLLGVSIPELMQGEDLSAELRRSAVSDRALGRSVFLSHATGSRLDGDLILAAEHAHLMWTPLPWRGVRTRRWTYARNLDGPWLLFDNDEDPLQLRNLVSDTGYRAVRADLEERLEQLMASADDPLEPFRQLSVRRGLIDEMEQCQRFWREGLADLAAARRSGDPSELQAAISKLGG
jgi:arylsulfatase A-like enzyme